MIKNNLTESEEQHLKRNWKIAIPGVLGSMKFLENMSFQEVINKYFVGYNVPYLVLDRKGDLIEEFQQAYERVRKCGL